MIQPAHAQLEHLTDPRWTQLGERYEAFQAGGGGRVSKPEVLFARASVADDGGGVRVAVNGPEGTVEATTAALALPEDWRGYERLRVELEDLAPSVRLTVTVVGARSLLSESFDLEGAGPHRVELSLRDLPLTAGIRQAYAPAAVRLSVGWSGEYAPAAFTLRDVSLRPAKSASPPVVDRFGQRIATDWPGKVARDEDLRAAADREAEALAQTPPHADRNAFGGWTGGPRFDATGFFRVEHDGGRWWLVTPEGHPFWSVGTTGVRLTDTTTPEGREHLYAGLPDRHAEGPAADAWYDNPPPPHRGGVSFYHLNVLRKYGSVDAWLDRVIQRFKAWGFNTFGSWCGPMCLGQRRLPYTVFLHSRGEAAPMLARQFPDVYDPAWEAWFDAAVAAAAGEHRDNPYLLGYFVDNESGWDGFHPLKAPPEAAARRAWVEFLRQRCGGLDAINAAFGLDLEDAEHAAGLTHGQATATEAGAALADAFKADYADRFFRAIRDTLRRHDPHHLYLGCRFTRGMSYRPAAAAVGRYADVVSVNCYGVTPPREQFEDWHRLTGRPILIGEHHFPLASPRQLPPLYPAFSPDQRRAMYVDFVRSWAGQPWAVGNHWFQHADQPLTGRGHDGENQTVGFVDITDQPHEELVAAAREATANVYAWHAAGA